MSPLLPEQIPQPQVGVVSYLQQLIRYRSVTPDQAGAMDWLEQQLETRGFRCHRFYSNGVTNLIADYYFSEGAAFAFSGHIDVVPATATGWRVAPFSGDIVDGAIYGRGAADMKGGVAAMLSATDALLADDSAKKGHFYWLITSDEEGEAEHGSQLIAHYLQQQGIELDGCLVGEPTADKQVGDTIKNGRRGAISGRIQVKGKAGHVAYPEHTVNAAQIAGELVTRLGAINFTKDIESSKTTLQVTGLSVPNIVDNMVPAKCEITFNVRYSHGYHSDDIVTLIAQQLARFKDCFTIEWERPCEPYYTGKSDNRIDLLAEVESAIHHCTHSYPRLSTSGGTSDGRFFANNHTQVVECGVRNHTIHQVNEHVPIGDLHAITAIYTQTLKQLFVR